MQWWWLNQADLKSMFWAHSRHFPQGWLAACNILLLLLVRCVWNQLNFKSDVNVKTIHTDTLMSWSYLCLHPSLTRESFTAELQFTAANGKNMIVLYITKNTKHSAATDLFYCLGNVIQYLSKWIHQTNQNIQQIELEQLYCKNISLSFLTFLYKAIKQHPYFKITVVSTFWNLVESH